MDTEICEQVDIYEQVREAVRQAVSDTLARIATRDDLNTLLLQLMPTPAADNVVRVSPPAPPPATPSSVRLTAREQEILERITAGDSNKEIARAFDLSLHTVKRHVANILTKLGVSSRVQAATWKYARH